MCMYIHVAGEFRRVKNFANWAKYSISQRKPLRIANREMWARSYYAYSAQNLWIKLLQKSAILQNLPAVHVTKDGHKKRTTCMVCIHVLDSQHHEMHV